MHQTTKPSQTYISNAIMTHHTMNEEIMHEVIQQVQSLGQSYKFP